MGMIEEMFAEISNMNKHLLKQKRRVHSKEGYNDTLTLYM